MSGGPKKHTEKHSLRALAKSRERHTLESRAISSRAVEGDPEVRSIGLWSEERDTDFASCNDDYTRMYKEYLATNNVSRRADILRALRKMRKDVVQANKKLSGMAGLILLPMTLAAEDWTDQKMENALQGFKPTRLEPNPYGTNLEFNYSPQSVTPWDAGFFVSHLAVPEFRPLMKELTKWCFAYPSLLAITSKMQVALKARHQVPKYESIAGAWMDAVKHQKQVAVLTRMRNLPDPMSAEIDETKSSGYPYSIMWQPGSHLPMDKVWHLTGTLKQEPLTDRLEKDVRETMKFLVSPEKCKHYDKRLLMYGLQAGNVKHILRSEYGSKPDRGIYSAPVMVRLISGAISQEFARNWYHPGDVTAESFMYGGAAIIVAKMTGRYAQGDTAEKSLEKVLPLFDLKKPTPETVADLLGPEMTVDHHVRELHLKDGRFSFPDKKWYDLMLRGEFMRDFSTYTDGVLPKPDDLVALAKDSEKPLTDEQAVKKVKAWMKVNKRLHHNDRHAAVVTNRRYLFKLDGEKSEDGYGNPSGSPWTAKRNTWTNLCEEDAADILIWKELHPNHEVVWQQCPVKCACGDDLSLWWRDWGDAREKEWALRKEVIKRIGHTYKEETLKVSQNLSSMEFLGRRIFAYVDSNEKVLGFFGVRPAVKVMASVIYPKHMPPKGASMDAYGLARMIAANDELGLISGTLRDGLREAGLTFSNLGVKPVHDDFEEDLWWSPPKTNTFRSLRDLMQLHLGGDYGADVDTPGASDETEGEADDESFSEDDLAPIIAPSPKPGLAREGTAEAKAEDAATAKKSKAKQRSAEKAKPAQEKGKGPKAPPQKQKKGKPSAEEKTPVKEQKKKSKGSDSDSDVDIF